MRNRVWMMVCLAGMMMSAAAAHAEGAGNFSCTTPNRVSFELESYSVRPSKDNGRTPSTVSFRTRGVNWNDLASKKDTGGQWDHCTIGPVGGGAGTYELTDVHVTALTKTNSIHQPVKTKEMVDATLSAGTAVENRTKK